MQIAFYKGRKRLFNRVTSWWLRGLYSHCELVLGVDSDGLSTCASSSFMDGGVRVKGIALDPDHWDLVEVGGNLARAVWWLDAHEHESYDVLGLLGFLVRAIKHSKRKWLCSEAVAEMLGMHESWRFDPCSLHAAVSAREGGCA